MAEVERGSIIQANENSNDWCGTVLIVSEVREWGVQAFLHVPGQGDAFIRLNHEQYDPTGGHAVLMPALD